MHLIRGDQEPSNLGAPRTGVARRSLADSQVDFTRLYTAVQERAIGYAVEYGDPDPEDAAQQAFTQLWTSCYEDGETIVENAEALFFKILRDVCRDRRRRERAQDSLLANPKLTLHVSDRLEELTAVKQVSEDNELQNRVSYIIETMREPRRTLFRTALHNGWDVRAAAAECGAKYDTARWHVAEALRTVREKLERDGYAVPKALQRGRRMKRKDS